MKIFDVVTVGSALKDIMFYSDKVSVIENPKNILEQKLLSMEYGTKIPIDEVHVNYGGGGLNVAVGLKNFGLDVAPMVNLGDDLVGKEVFYYLRKNSIDTSLINVERKAKTGFSIVVTSKKDKEHTIFTYKGASSSLKLPGLRSFRTSWFYVSALSGKNWAIEFEKIVRQTRRNIKIVWNPGLVQLKDYNMTKKFLPFIDVLILNKDEALELVCNLNKKIKRVTLKNGFVLLDRLKELGPLNVIVTRGEKGVLAIDEHGRKYNLVAKSDKKRIVDTVGAGDSFGSGFLAGWMRWLNFEKALWLGLKNATQNLYKIGAQNGLLKIKL
ncbi:MAG: Carbohydrate kinase [Parcubacteria group bacterium GW2011_GWC2_39_14]|nr:MAG: Carbohydrate kinase [Parcubacteria group bacterium GW2011_GWC2_39_14]KKR53364.1 MAG: Carbohydrate kinase [Parcubacteria group bacterium GW2011_GWA2_40_23]